MITWWWGGSGVAMRKLMREAMVQHRWPESAFDRPDERPGRPGGVITGDLQARCLDCDATVEAVIDAAEAAAHAWASGRGRAVGLACGLPDQQACVAAMDRRPARLPLVLPPVREGQQPPL